MSKKDYSNEAYVYWFYNKYTFETYFGSRTAYEGSYKDDFISNYNSSSEDEKFLQALENDELVGEVIAVFTGGTYKEVGKKSVIYEHTLIEMFWDNVGKEHSYNHYANGKFNVIGRKATEKERKARSIDLKEKYKDKKEREKQSERSIKRYKDKKEREKSSIAQKRSHLERPERRKKQSQTLKNTLSTNVSIKEKHSKDMTNHPSLSKIVLQYTIDGKFIKEYPSCREANRQTSISNINCVCVGKRKQAGGFIWKYKE